MIYLVQNARSALRENFMDNIQLLGTIMAVLSLVILFGGFYWLIKKDK